MKLPTIEGVIRRRILVNYRVKPELITPLLPSCFRPHLINGQAIAGICLIRLEHIRPKGLPAAIGVSSENAAHRIAVLWNDQRGITREGVFIPRRDTGSYVNHIAGGRVFPGQHHMATFSVRESEVGVALSMHSHDDAVTLELEGRSSDAFPVKSVFRSVDEASSFFERGSLGYSVTKDANRLDGLILDTKRWRVDPFEVAALHSSYFEDDLRFPAGGAVFDHALIMRNVDHEWHSAADLQVGAKCRTC